MSLLGKLVGGAVKTALTPIAIVKDVGNVLTGEDVDSIKEDLEDIIDGDY